MAASRLGPPRRPRHRVVSFHWLLVETESAHVRVIFGNVPQPPRERTFDPFPCRHRLLKWQRDAKAWKEDGGADAAPHPCRRGALSAKIALAYRLGDGRGGGDGSYSRFFDWDGDYVCHHDTSLVGAGHAVNGPLFGHRSVGLRWRPANAACAQGSADEPGLRQSTRHDGGRQGRRTSTHTVGVPG